MKKNIYQLQNDHLSIAVKGVGAELCSIKKNKREYLWQGDEQFWSGQSPLLFPVVGGLKGGGYFYKGNFYKMPKHGFLRGAAMPITKQTDQSLEFSFEHNSKTLKIYPFQFCFSVVFELIENSLKISHKVENRGGETMYFSTGGHPAFFCNTDETSSYENCYLRFDKAEPLETQLVDMASGLIKNKYQNLPLEKSILPLQKDSFQNDALIFSNLASTEVTFGNHSKGDLVSVGFEQMPYIAFWSKENASFVCIEPWAGIGDLTDSNQDITKKAGIVPLCAGEKTNRSYTIKIL